MITAAQLTGENVKHWTTIKEAVEAFESCALDLTPAEREGCLQAIRRSPGRAFECYRAIRYSQTAKRHD
jgi:hypothetical protein